MLAVGINCYEDDVIAISSNAVVESRLEGRAFAEIDTMSCSLTPGRDGNASNIGLHPTPDPSSTMIISQSTVARISFTRPKKDAGGL